MSAPLLLFRSNNKERAQQSEADNKLQKAIINTVLVELSKDQKEPEPSKIEKFVKGVTTGLGALGSGALGIAYGVGHAGTVGLAQTIQTEIYGNKDVDPISSIKNLSTQLQGRGLIIDNLTGVFNRSAEQHEIDIKEQGPSQTKQFVTKAAEGLGTGAKKVGKGALTALGALGVGALGVGVGVGALGVGAGYAGTFGLANAISTNIYGNKNVVPISSIKNLSTQLQGRGLIIDNLKGVFNRSAEIHQMRINQPGYLARRSAANKVESERHKQEKEAAEEKKREEKELTERQYQNWKKHKAGTDAEVDAGFKQDKAQEDAKKEERKQQEKEERDKKQTIIDARNKQIDATRDLLLEDAAKRANAENEGVQDRGSSGVPFGDSKEARQVMLLKLGILDPNKELKQNIFYNIAFPVPEDSVQNIFSTLPPLSGKLYVTNTLFAGGLKLRSQNPLQLNVLVVFTICISTVPTFLLNTMCCIIILYYNIFFFNSNVFNVSISLLIRISTP
jgi:hypothetical protein